MAQQSVLPVSARHFFGSVAGSACWATLCFALITVFISAARSDYSDGEMAYKRGMFVGVLGKKLSVNEKINGYELKGRNVGKYYRDAKEAGIDLQKISPYLARAAEAGDYATAKDLIAVLREQYGTSDAIPDSIFPASQSLTRWTFNDEELKIFNLALQGKAEMPPWYNNYPLLPSWINWWTFIFVIQNVAYVTYCINLERRFRWYHFPWNKVWPYIGVPMLLPGAIPVMIVFGGVVGMMYAFTRIEESRKMPKQSMFDVLDSFMPASKERMKKLQERVKRT